ncbi:hypothetical protein T492DRAFT_577145, partial [Pavlovales sp. CCMP2436]
IGSLTPQNMANTAWAFATLGVRVPELFDAIARESEQRIDTFNPQGLANIAWSFATLGLQAPQLFDAIARVSEERASTFNSQELTNTAWAFATHGVQAPQLFGAIARASEQNIGSFTAQGLANTAWAFAVVGTTDRCELVKAISARAAEMGLPALSNEQRRQLHQEAVRAATAKYAGIVIEVDGPTHYNDEQRLRPASEMIRRHLTLAGWAVLGVPYWEWNALKGPARKADYLAKL